MNLGLQLVLGGLRRGSFTPVPPPVTVTAPSPYYGHSRINATSLSATIGFIEDPDGQEAPVSVAAYANIAIAGTRRLTTKPLNGYEHCHTVWTLTKGDGTAISETHDGIYNYRHNPATQQVEGTPVNVHTDTISPEFTDLMLNHGDYKLTLEVYAMTHTGECLLATAEHSFTVAKPTNNHIYIDPVGGLDTNDGLDPLGLSLTNASYVEATGILTETGKFTGLVLDAEQYDTDTANFIHLTGFGRARIAEVIDANSVRIDDRWKLGSDQTGLTSSNGPKQSIDYTPANNTVYLLKAGEYDITQAINFGSSTGICGLYSYGGSGRIISNTIPAGTNTSNLILTGSPSPSTISPDKLMISRFELDSQDVQSAPIRGGYGPVPNTRRYRTIFRHLDQKRSNAVSVTTLGTPTGNDTGPGVDILIWGGTLNNLKTADRKKTIALFIYLNTRCSLRTIGVITDNDVYDPDPVESATLVSSGRYHHWYPTGFPDHFHVGWCYFRDGYGSNYCINNDVESALGEYTRIGTSYHDCYMGSAFRCLDFSNHTNSDVMYFDDIHLARIQTNVEQDFLFPFRAKSLFATDIDHYAFDPKQTSAFFRGAALPEWNFVFQNIRNYGPAIYTAGTDTPTVEFFDSESVMTRDVDDFQIRQFQPSLSESSFTDNAFYSPNAPDGDVYQIDGTLSPLSALNALTNSSGNTESTIAWSDWPPIEPPNEITFISAVANGESGVTNSSEITMTFSEDPGEIADTDFTVTDATRGALSGTGTTRVLAISDITVLDSATVNVAIADNNGNTFSPNNRDVTVYKAESSRLYLNPPNDTSALIAFDVGATNDRVFDGQGIRFKVITSDVTTAFGGGIAKDASNYLRFRPLENGGNGAIDIRQGGGFSTTAAFFINLPSQATLWDGEEHFIELPFVANAAVTVSIDGVPYAHPTVTFAAVTQFDFSYLRGGGNYYIYDLEVYDVATDATIMIIDIDSGTLVGTEAAPVGTGTLTLNVAEGDWTDTPA